MNDYFKGFGFRKLHADLYGADIVRREAILADERLQREEETRLDQLREETVLAASVLRYVRGIGAQAQFQRGAR